MNLVTLFVLVVAGLGVMEYRRRQNLADELESVESDCQAVIEHAEWAEND